jgi:hypothetical protein
MAQFTRLLALSLFAVAASTASAQVPGCSASDPDVACTLQGAVRGVVVCAAACRAVALETDGGRRSLVRRA